MASLVSNSGLGRRERGSLEWDRTGSDKARNEDEHDTICFFIPLFFFLKRSCNVYRQRCMCGGALKCFWMVMMRRDEWRRVGLGEPVWNQDGMNQHIMCTLCKCLLLWLMEVRPVHDCPLLFQGLSLGRGQIEANFICRLHSGSVTTHYTPA